jgi:hypothetical protein
VQTTSAAPQAAACPAKRGFLNVGIATVVPGVLRELGTDPDPILKDAGLSRRLLKDRSCRLSVNVLGKLLRLCAERTACSHIGLVVGEKVTLSAFGDLGSLMKVSERTPGPGSLPSSSESRGGVRSSQEGRSGGLEQRTIEREADMQFR